MGNVTNLTTSQIQKVQFDEAVVILNYGLSTEKILGPTRGGGEFSATVTVRDVEFDGKIGKTAGMQVIEEQAASIKVTSLCISQDELALAVPGSRLSTPGSTGILKNPVSGLLATTNYLTNVSMFGKLADGTYKRATIYNGMTEKGMTIKCAPKAEGELELEFIAHYATTALDGDLWEVKEVAAFRAPLLDTAEASTNGLTVSLTFSHAMSATGLDKANFTVKQSDVSKTISSVALDGADAKIVNLTMSQALTAGTTLTVAYTKGTAVDTNGEYLATFAATAVVNNVTGG